MTAIEFFSWLGVASVVLIPLAFLAGHIKGCMCGCISKRRDCCDRAT